MQSLLFIHVSGLMLYAQKLSQGVMFIWRKINIKTKQKRFIT